MTRGLFDDYDFTLPFLKKDEIVKEPFIRTGLGIEESPRPKSESGLEVYSRDTYADQIEAIYDVVFQWMYSKDPKVCECFVIVLLLSLEEFYCLLPMFRHVLKLVNASENCVC